MRGWNLGDKVRGARGVVGTITGLSTLGAWINVRGHLTCIGWGVGGMPDREDYERELAAREMPLFVKGGEP